jgi:hypothetical protein
MERSVNHNSLLTNSDQQKNTPPIEKINELGP